MYEVQNVQSFESSQIHVVRKLKLFQVHSMVSRCLKIKLYGMIHID